MRAKSRFSYGRSRRRFSASSGVVAPAWTARSSSASASRSISVDPRAQLVHRARARTRHLEADAPGPDRVAGLRDPSEPLEDEAADRLVLALRKVPAEALVQIRHRGSRAHHEDARGDAPEELAGSIIFVLDFADNLLDQILHRDEPDE